MLTGCASILDSGDKAIHIDSHPEGAKVTISNQDGTQICVTNTPAKVYLARSAGYFKGAAYTIHFEKTGYYAFDSHVDSNLDGWYVGNIFFGGLIGMVLVDPLTGDMYVPSSREVDCNLMPMQTPPATH